jgi:hypothetical protein
MLGVDERELSVSLSGRKELKESDRTHELVQPEASQERVGEVSTYVAVETTWKLLTLIDSPPFLPLVDLSLASWPSFASFTCSDGFSIRTSTHSSTLSVSTVTRSRRPVRRTSRFERGRCPLLLLEDLLQREILLGNQRLDLDDEAILPMMLAVLARLSVDSDDSTESGRRRTTVVVGWIRLVSNGLAREQGDRPFV